MDDGRSDELATNGADGGRNEAMTHFPQLPPDLSTLSFEALRELDCFGCAAEGKVQSDGEPELGGIA